MTNHSLIRQNAYACDLQLDLTRSRGMNSSPLLKDIRQLDGRTDEQLEHHQRDILRRIASLAFPHEVWDVLINHNALRLLVNLDIDRTAIVWKHPFIEEFIDAAWANGHFKQQTYNASNHFEWTRKATFHLISCISQPRLIWISHVLCNIAYFVFLTVFTRSCIYSLDLLARYPHPLETVIIIIFYIPSLFPPYTVTFLGYLVIDILFLISFIFRSIVWKEWPRLSIHTITLLLNARTLLSYLPLIQILNVVILTFPLPPLKFVRRLLYPLLPIAISVFIGFFLALHFLADTHNSVQHTFDVLLRTVLLNIDPGSLVQFHPVAGRIVYYLFAFSSLYFFWGVGIAGVGMKIVKDTDWHAERVRRKAIQLLRYLPERKTVRKKRLLGRGKVVSSMPFNVIEGIGVIFRLHWLSLFAVYLGMVPIAVCWSLGLVCGKIGLRIWALMGKVGLKIMDEVEDEGEPEGDVSSEDDTNESTRLLS